MTERTDIRTAPKLTPAASSRVTASSSRPRILSAATDQAMTARLFATVRLRINRLAILITIQAVARLAATVTK
ncbi:hypothetical protein MnTg02_02675 [bacterium MnTg02]|nr:hypothetical protein MnTg02_02675 [bacterium MnTg02]